SYSVGTVAGIISSMCGYANLTVQGNPIAHLEGNRERDAEGQTLQTRGWWRSMSTCDPVWCQAMAFALPFRRQRKNDGAGGVSHRDTQGSARATFRTPQGVGGRTGPYGGAQSRSGRKTG